jgi:probable phosphoglycerate mutase
MFQIYLIRAGQTEFERQGRVQGTLDIPLCEDGRREVATLAGELSLKAIDAVYAGPSQAAQHTADALAGALGTKTKTVDQLHNLDFGLWQGMLISEVKTKQPKVYRQLQDQPETVCPPQGETVTVARQRVQSVVAKIVKKHKSEGAVAVVVPEPLASIARQVLSNGELGDFWQNGQGNPPWAVFALPEVAAAK